MRRKMIGVGFLGATMTALLLAVAVEGDARTRGDTVVYVTSQGPRAICARILAMTVGPGAASCGRMSLLSRFFAIDVPLLDRDSPTTIRWARIRCG